MKVGLIISGLVRSNSSKNSLINHIIKKYSCDVYCQCWYMSEQTKSIDESIIRESYAPKKLIMQQHINLKDNFSQDYYPELINIHGTHGLYNQGFSQLLGLKTVSNLFEWSEYDFIIRARYDKINMINFPDLSKLDKNNLYTSCCFNCWYQNHPKFFVDQCFILPNTMKYYCEAFDYLLDRDFCDKMYSWKTNYSGKYFFPELLFAYMIDHFNCRNNFKKLSCNEFSYSLLN